MERTGTGNEENSLFMENVINFLEANKEEIARKATDRIYRDFESYKKGGMPAEESHESLLKLMEFIITSLKSGDVRIESPFMQNVIQFEEGLACRRVTYRIELADLLHSMRIFRNEIWKALESEFWQKADCRCLFKLEGRLNKFFINHMISVSVYYLHSQEEVIKSQEHALKKWEDIMSTASRIDLAIPCRNEFALVARSQAETIARRANFNEEEIQEIKTAVGEAVDNAIEHGYSEKGINLHYVIGERDFQVIVVDFGKGFDSRGKGLEMPDLLAERGRGIFLMRKTVDEVEIDSVKGRGTTLILTKFRNPKAAAKSPV